MEANCPVCGKHIFRHKRKVGLYRLYLCKNCNSEFLIPRTGKNYNCPRFEDCATSMKKLNCKTCEVSRA